MRMNKTVQYYFAYQFIKYLVKDFTRWKAYDLGLIDQDGMKLRDPEGGEEEELMSPFFNLVRKTKRLISKVPGGRSVLGSIVTAGFLLKEELNCDEYLIESIIQESWQNRVIEDPSFDKYLSEDRIIPLEPGVYKNTDETDEFYGGRHLFYINEEKIPDPTYPGLEIFHLNNSLQYNITISKDHLERIR